MVIFGLKIFARLILFLVYVVLLLRVIFVNRFIFVLVGASIIIIIV